MIPPHTEEKQSLPTGNAIDVDTVEVDDEYYYLVLTADKLHIYKEMENSPEKLTLV